MKHENETKTYRRDEHTYRELFRKLELPLVLIERDRIIRDLNPALCQFFGYDEQELTGESANKILPDYAGLEDRRLEADDPRKNTLSVVLSTGRLKDSLDIPVELVANTVYLAEEPHHLISIEDGTQKQVLENRQAIDLTARNIANLSAALAHNFNNLLSPIIMAAELLQRETEKSNLQGRAHVILNYSKHLKEIVGKLNQFSGHSEFQPYRLSPSRVVQALEDYLPEILSEQIRPGINRQVDLWTISGSHEQLFIALSHLASNARHAMPKGGQLTLEASNVQLSNKDLLNRLDIKPGRFVKILVRDTGMGIPPHLHQKIFEPFFPRGMLPQAMA